jgi:hypothetical protein
LFSDFFDAWTSFLDVDDQGIADLKRARRSSNSGRAEATLNMAPLLGAIAARGSGRAVIGWCTAVGGVVVTQPPSSGQGVPAGPGVTYS